MLVFKGNFFGKTNFLVKFLTASFKTLYIGFYKLDLSRFEVPSEDEYDNLWIFLMNSALKTRALQWIALHA